MGPKWMHVVVVVVLCFLVVLATVDAFPEAGGAGAIEKSQTPKQPRKDYQHRELVEIETLLFNDTVEFYANETWLHRRTDSVQLSYDQCVQYRYFITGIRTRLRVYICRMTEGGQCIMQKFRAEKGTHSKEGCMPLVAWMGRADEYAVHIQFERRPRKFNDKDKEERYRRRRRLGRAAHRLVGKISFESIVKCRDVCPDE